MTLVTRHPLTQKATTTLLFVCHVSKVYLMYYIVDKKFNMLYGFNNHYYFPEYRIFLTNFPNRAISFNSYSDAELFAIENCLTAYAIEFID